MRVSAGLVCPEYLRTHENLPPPATVNAVRRYINIFT